MTGFAYGFLITSHQVKGDAVSEYMYNLFYERKADYDLDIDHYIVNLWQPVEEQAGTYKARKIRQTC